MKIAIYGRSFNELFYDAAQELFSILLKNDISIIIYKPFYEFLVSEVGLEPEYEVLFAKHKEITTDIDFLFSIGGDGTFLETISYVRDKGVPIIGINSGRLGYLATVAKEEIAKAMHALFDGNYTIESRSLLTINANGGVFNDFPFALNELTVHKNDSASMITVHTYVNEEFLNSYWSDGLIVSTPTGSTAYSLSAGGPIVVPNSNNFVITPLAPHNLTVRPIIVSDDNVITLKVEGRSVTYLASMDYRSEVLESSEELVVRKADFCIRIVKFDYLSYFSTLRNKLMWGLDKRN